MDERRDALLAEWDELIQRGDNNPKYAWCIEPVLEDRALEIFRTTAFLHQGVKS